MKRLLASLLGTWLISLAALIPAFGADSTSFDPTTVQVKAKGSGGVPVGTIVAWPVAKNPSDMANWLECNGQSISQSAFPELFALVGANVPDLRGLFLRGLGGKSAALGVTQNDILKQPNTVAGKFGWSEGMSGHYYTEGAFSMTDIKSGVNWKGSSNDYTHPRAVELRLAGAWPQNSLGNETRPINKAVRYLIRARP